MGVLEKDVFIDRGKLSIPGWFRRDKQWDVLAYGKKGLIAAIELKSILSSYGNNTNNRIEEALGSGIDSAYASKYGLYSSDETEPYPPIFAYVMIIGDDDKSNALLMGKKLDNRLKPDPNFEITSYIGRHAIALKRMLREKYTTLFG